MRIVHQTLLLENLFDQVRNDQLRMSDELVPSGPPWGEDSVLQLLDSVRRGYPIGSLLLWSTPELYRRQTRIGPLEVTPQHVSLPSYVLDGRQRIAALFGVFRLNDARANQLQGLDRLFRVRYDPDLDRFLPYHAPHTNRQVPAHWLLGEDEALYSCDAGLRRQIHQFQTRLMWCRIHCVEISEASREEALEVWARLCGPAPTRQRGGDLPLVPQ